MTAKEMFKELRYELVEDGRMFLVYRYTGEAKFEISFNRFNYYYQVSNLRDNEKVFSPKLHQAIHQQMQELGWLE